MVFDPDALSFFRQQAKAALRKRHRAQRAAIPLGGLRSRSDKIVERVIAGPAFGRARAVALFSPMLERNEVDVRPLDRAARESGKIVLYPFQESASELTLRAAELESLDERGHGFSEPPENAPTHEGDANLLIIVPALAVDLAGQRVGYGKGFYDRLLARIRPPAFAIAVVYDFELVAEVPAGDHDRPVDMVITDLQSFEIEESKV